MAKSKILVGLEIGTSKTCMVVGEIRPDATATILGAGLVHSAGVRRGEIVDQAMARQCVQDAWQNAQINANVDILNVFLSITGDHIRGENHTGSYRLPDDEDIIDEEHMHYAREKAERLDLANGRFVINTETGGYSIDGGEPTLLPSGLSGRTLDVNSHIIHGVVDRVKNSLLCVRSIPLEVEEMVFAPLATAQMVLTRQQKETGALLIDIGGGTTDYICYINGEVVASGCVPYGGRAINSDIINSLNQSVSKEAAEYLKCVEGDAFGDVNDRSLAQFRSDLGLHEVNVERGVLNRIIRNRLASILLRVRDDIPPELLRRDGMCLFLSGGSSMMRGLDGLAYHIFRVPVMQPEQVGPGETHYARDPRYCTAVGLIRYAQRFDDDALAAENTSLLTKFLNIFRNR